MILNIQLPFDPLSAGNAYNHVERFKVIFQRKTIFRGYHVGRGYFRVASVQNDRIPPLVAEPQIEERQSLADFLLVSEDKRRDFPEIGRKPDFYPF